MKVLLSIKPEYVYKLFSGEKKYEFRRVIFKKPGVRTIVVYASAPIGMVIGELLIKRVITDRLESLWSKTCQYSGITEELFYKYFKNKDFGYAIEIESVKRYELPISLPKHFGVVPPQSFKYV